MSKQRNKKRPPKRVLALPDLEPSKVAVLNRLTSKSGQRIYDRAITDFVEWYSERARPSTAPWYCATECFWNRSYTQRRPSTSGWRPSDGWPLRQLTPVRSVRISPPEFDESGGAADRSPRRGSEFAPW
jgi:hypothetical protein